MKPSLKMRKFKVTVAVVPTTLDAQLFGATTEFREITVEGYTLKDAMKRAGVK